MPLKSGGSTLVIAILLLSILTIDLHAQESLPLNGPAVYLTYGGTTPGPSINGEFRVFEMGKRTAFFMTGFGMWNRKEYRYLSIPVGLNLVKGKGNHHTEIGTGLCYNEGSETAGTGVGNKSLYWMILSGYRYQRATGGFFFRIYYSPTIKLKEYGDTSHFSGDMHIIALNFGIGAGYSFRSH